MAGLAPLEIEEGFVDISEEQDGGLLKKILVDGRGEDTPPKGSAVEVHYVDTLHADGSKFDSSRDRPGNFKFDVGVGQVIKGWDVGICTMKLGEKAILRARHDFAYGEHGSPPKIPGEATLNFEVELFSWKEKVREPRQMNAEERLAHATKMKEQGTEAFKLQDFASAVNRYQDGVQYATYVAGGGGGGGGGDDSDDDYGGDEEDGPSDSAGKGELSNEAKTLAIALLNNCAMAQLKADLPDEAKVNCSMCLGLDEGNVKALFRRAQAQLATGDFGLCIADAVKVVEIDPSNKEAELLRRKALDAEKKAKQKEKAMFSKMFG